MDYSLSYALIMETKPESRETLVELFEGAGFEVRERSNSGSGIRLVMERSPGVVIVSEDMPTVDGVELLPLLRRLTKSPIIVIGEGDDTQVVRMLLQGADAYMTRPPNYREILSRARALMQRSGADPSDGNTSALTRSGFGSSGLSNVSSLIARIGNSIAGYIPNLGIKSNPAFDYILKLS